MKYSEKLRDPRWQKKRLKILERDEFTCRMCDRDDKTLNIHHLYYEKWREPWDYQDRFLITYCEDCHEAERTELPKNLEMLNDLLKMFGFNSFDIEKIAMGFNEFNPNIPPFIVSPVLSFIFSDKKTFEMCDKRYMEYLKKRKKKLFPKKPNKKGTKP